MISYLSTTLVLTGLLIHMATLIPLRRLIAILPAGSLRNKWLSMTGLVILFIAGYLGYIVIFWGMQTDVLALLIPSIFLFGAIFVWITIKLALQTAVDLLRIDSLEAESITDPLTKVFNRRYLDRRLSEEVARSRRYGLELSVLMLDIDHFKRVNDTHGHQAGDVTLSTLCNLIKNDLRELDVVARYGGEEFLVICTNTAIDDAALVAERLRHLVESKQFEIPDGAGASRNIPINISVGVACFSANVDSQEKMLMPPTKRYTAQKSRAETAWLCTKIKNLPCRKVSDPATKVRAIAGSAGQRAPTLHQNHVVRDISTLALKGSGSDITLGENKATRLK